MQENNLLKTFGFILVALLAAAGAYFSKPQPAKPTIVGQIGEDMFKLAPKDVSRMEILQYDETNHKTVPFEVAQVNGVFSIPSHSGYPADQKNHLAEAATALMGVKVLNIVFGKGDELGQLDADTIRARLNEYGVVDPENAKSSDKGIGMRVTLKNKDGTSLASAVIGKQVPDQTDQHYIRVAGKDQVCTVALDTSKFSTHFEDWIERNLLNLNSMDLKQVEIKDYSIDLVGNRALIKNNGQMTLDYGSSGDTSWKLTTDLEYKNKAFKPRAMLPDEEVDSAKLNELKTALDDLKIVDVERKPAAVPPDLRFKEGQLVEDILRSLEERGFYPAPDEERGPDCVQLLSNKGDVRLQLTDGACYVLRFGETTGDTSSTAKKPAKDKAKEEKKDEAAPGMNRYLFVMAEFNPAALPKPVMEPLPQEPKPEAKKPEETKAGEKKTDEKKPDEKKVDEKKDDKKDAKAEPVKKTEPPKVDIKAEIERITKENKRKQEEYDGKLAAGKKHVDDLNARFAPWYYVISDDVYRKIHLSREQIVKKKAKETKDKDGHDHEHDDHADAPPMEQPKAGPIGELQKAGEGAPGK
jgi:hypothetical protein